MNADCYCAAVPMSIRICPSDACPVEKADLSMPVKLADVIGLNVLSLGVRVD